MRADTVDIRNSTILTLLNPVDSFGRGIKPILTWSHQSSVW